jgi:predicted ATPase/DNA-binding SARP family transcriptional activator
VRIRLLGEVGADTGPGEPADVGPAKCQALLAALALSAGTAVPVWRLVELLWGDEPPRTAGRTLQSYVARLRKGLGRDCIVRAGAAYRLAVTADAVDVLRFQRCLDAGDIDGALAEWTGFPLAGLAVPGLVATVDGLVERWLGVMEADLERRAGADPVAAIGPLTELTASYPFREGLWALLMTALYRTGRQADALAAYRTARQHLIEDLGVEPGPRLRELEARILGHSEELGGDRQAVARDPHRGNLPRRLGRLIGRERVLGAIDDALAGFPVVTLVGPGGIGKTRLALETARRATAGDGTWLADLTEIGSVSDVARAVAGCLGIREGSGLALDRSVVMALRSRRLLLVLDNCEHVIDGAAELAQAIAEQCQDVRILATSRQHLGLGHGLERVITVAPLEPAGPGAELFNERAAAVSPAFDAQAGRHAVVEICRRLDGVPLAIELAAARTTSLTPEDIARRLDDHLRLLAVGRRAGAERHRTLRATIQWSYDLLSPPARRLFRRLSVFTGPFDLAGAEIAAADPALAAADVGDLLSDLAERSMVVVERGRLFYRFRLLESTRQFAAGHLAEDGDSDAVARRHAHWCLEQAVGIRRLLSGPAEIEGVARLDELWPNYRAAFEWACSSGDRSLAHALVRPVVVEVVRRGRAEIGDWMERLLAMASPGDTELIAFGLTWAAQRYKVAQDPAAYDRLADRYGEPDHPLTRHARAAAHQDWDALAQRAGPAIAWLRQDGQDDLAEQFELEAAAALLFSGHVEESDARIAALADQYRRDGPPTLLHLSLVLLGHSATLRGHPDRAEQLFADALDVDVPERTQSPAKSIEARIAFRRGDQARAFRALSAYIDELLGAGNMQAICITCVEFINMMAEVNRLPEAALLLGHLDKTAPYWAPEVAKARSVIAAAWPAGHPDLSTHPSLDDHEALEYMRSVLHQLTDVSTVPTGS